MLDIYTIIFLALALFIFIRLRSVLGQRTGRERPPFNMSPRDAARPQGNDKVIPLPNRVPAGTALEPEPAPDRWGDLAEAGSPLARGLDAIAAADRSFDPKTFLSGARAAYEMIVTAFAAGDRRTLKSLLAKDVYDSFVAAIADRETRGETVDSKFVSIDKTEIAQAEVKDGAAQLTIRFVSQLITATRDKAGAVIDGSPDQVTDVTDMWTFARDVNSRDPNWKLIATEAA